MKKYLLVMTLVLFGGVLLNGLHGTTAKNLSIAEKFANSPVEGETGVYTIDPNHSAIGFEVLHMGLVNVPGFFTDFSGTVSYNAEDVTKSSVEFTAKTASVDTRVAGRDKHLRSADFFDVENHPEMTFRSTKVEKKGDMLRVTGDFTLRGVKKTIELQVKIAGFADGRGGSKVMGATAETMIDRTAYNVSHSLGGVSKDVKITLNIEAGMARKETAEK
jgi:polyisoprenoid-binding protein YceI